MKRFVISFAAALIASLSFALDVDIHLETIENHKYIIADKGKYSGCLAIVHSESCWCKNYSVLTVSVDKIQGPRLFSKKMRLQKYEEQKGICSHCSNHFEFAEMEGDHILPYSKGGKTEYRNLQMLCAPCNRKKSNKYDY